jgi:hypothetical protein
VTSLSLILVCKGRPLIGELGSFLVRPSVTLIEKEWTGYSLIFWRCLRS